MTKQLSDLTDNELTILIKRKLAEVSLLQARQTEIDYLLALKEDETKQVRVEVNNRFTKKTADEIPVMKQEQKSTTEIPINFDLNLEKKEVSKMVNEVENNKENKTQQTLSDPPQKKFLEKLSEISSTEINVMLQRIQNTSPIEIDLSQ